MSPAFVAGQATANPFPTPDLTAGAPRITAGEWSLFQRRFMEGGRIIDVDNAGQTHSEGQGYGLIFALEANDRGTFDQIWRFTKANLQIRSDALFAWRWRADTSPRVTDTNNATDGDILIAYALLRGALQWNDRLYAHEAQMIIGDIRKKLIDTVGGRQVLLPAYHGFKDTANNPGPVVNLSYYIYSAFQLFDALEPKAGWLDIARGGLDLTYSAQRGRIGLVPDWIAVSARDVMIADGFNPRSSYDAVRIPLYMALANVGPDSFAPFDRAWNLNGAGHPIDYHIKMDTVLAPMKDPGYRMIAALAACATRGVPIPASLQTFRPTTYFASSLHLLGLVAARQNYAHCLAPDMSTVVIASARSVPAPIQPRVHTAAPAAPQPVAMRNAQVLAPARPAETRSRHRAMARDLVTQGANSFSDRMMRKSYVRQAMR
ncbi:glycosyl hydrolase family 8 [Acuticoccus kandeliae]|uniref:glycosyl hydrolase family 8 n=1 Tax=Acuticoccus kandeliae TaxID=2073160 RepID=UPI00130025F9|nr:glycosyl hydrolase family 8 [Acuticoccus kandeliae]